MAFSTVAVVGVGLIGGSFALALRKAGFTGRILGVSSPPAVRAALEKGVIDEAKPLEEALREADLVYLAQTIERIIETLKIADRFLKPGALVTDAGSTKAEIAAAGAACIRRGRFLGGHPMAGKETRGVEQAEADLFAGRTYVLTPQSPQDLESPAAAEFVDWIRRIGARPVFLDPVEHDRIVSWTSHLPQLASTALAGAVARALERGEEAQIAGPGLRDMTRLAMSSYEVWRDILATNRQHILEALEAYICELEQLRRGLERSDLSSEFAAGAEFAARLRAKPPGDLA